MIIKGGDGNSIDQAIVITDCNHAEGIRQEYIELRKRFGEYKTISQGLSLQGVLAFDILTILVNNERKEIWFDITDFFAKDPLEKFMNDLIKAKMENDIK